MNWHELDAEVRELSGKLTERPDAIVAIVRGGLVPARLLATLLGVAELYCLTVVKDGDGRALTTDITANLEGKSVLLVEDAVESGKSLAAAEYYLEDRGASVTTACLYARAGAKHVPDHYLKTVDAIPEFPWERV
ncbi:MAG: hypothetical protein KGI41_00845 [Patescibacteria group bacterium]|nr:hypothetical protein [Patescibacteria group bacterium]MDE1965776.1 hypothetical protein [Patescibacteria group bacterium]